MIVLYLLVIVHGRMGGFWRDHGMCIIAAFGNCIVAFSWWGVNLLETGLHTYGFTSGLGAVVNGFYLSQVVVGLLGLAALWLERHREAAVADEILEQAEAPTAPVGATDPA